MKALLIALGVYFQLGAGHFAIVAVVRYRLGLPFTDFSFSPPALGAGVMILLSSMFYTVFTLAAFGTLYLPFKGRLWVGVITQSLILGWWILQAIRMHSVLH